MQILFLPFSSSFTIKISGKNTAGSFPVERVSAGKFPFSTSGRVPLGKFPFSISGRFPRGDFQSKLRGKFHKVKFL